jgi:hypothetical protein
MQATAIDKGLAINAAPAQLSLLANRLFPFPPAQQQSPEWESEAEKHELVPGMGKVPRYVL